jgi:putative N-acetylmannosamine-6-phosphate epimerase
MYENTMLALKQIERDLIDENELGTTIADYRKQRSSRQEAEAFDRIKELCEDIISVLNDMRYNDPDYVEIDEDDE